MPRIDFTFPSFRMGLVDGLSNDTAPIEGLRVCNDVDYGKPPIGGAMLRSPIANRPLTKDFTARHLIRLPDSEGYNYVWVYILIGEREAWVFNRRLDEWRGPIELSTYMGHPYVLPVSDSKIFFTGITATNGPRVLERDGHSWSDWVVRFMGFPSITFSGTAGDADTAAIEDGDHYYQLILTDENGHRSVPFEKNDVVKIATVTSGTANEGQVVFSTLPTCVGNHKYLYRSPTYTSSDPDPLDNPEDVDKPLIYYLVDVLRGEQISYTDTKPDATIQVNEVLDTGAGLPPHDLTPLALFNGSMWSATRLSSILRYTPQFDYENWPALNAIPLGNFDPILYLLPLGDKLLVFKRSSLYGFWGSNVGNFDYRELSAIHGVGYTQTVKALDENRVIFVDPQKRVMLFDGNGFTEISKMINLPESDFYWASLYGDYYVLWMYQWTPGDIDEPLTRPPPWEPPDGEQEDGEDPHKPPYDRPRDRDQPPRPPTDPGVPHDMWPPDVQYITAYAYHIPSGVWVNWRNIDGLIPCRPDRAGINNLVYWDNHQVRVLGMKTGPIQYGDFEIRTLNTDCGQPTQEKSFKEIEIYFEYISDADFDGTIGQLELILDDADDNQAVFQQTINYNTGNPSKRQKFRIPNGVNGTRASIRFVGNDNMKDFALLQARLWYEPRGTAIRG